MKKIFLVIIAVFTLAMSGCKISAVFGAFPDPVDDSNDDPVVVSVSAEIPDIVFTVRYVYNRYGNDFDKSSEQGRYLLTFLDKNGNYYSSDHNDIFVLSDEELIEALKSGDERITKSSATCDVDELRENFDKLLKVAENKEYELVYPEVVPAVEYDHITWYGLYFDKDGNLLSLPIHERMQTEIEANDDRANEIYKWYASAAKKQ